MLEPVKTYEEIGVDPQIAPGWSRAKCLAHQAFIVRVTDDVVWLAMVDPMNIYAVDDACFLTGRVHAAPIVISRELLEIAMRELHG